ncbi:M20 family metallopeptidase [Methylobacterium organophilum]|uniref:M20 aminoacylase family protein n=1 Tax=Methylobacterium organophilum TaxID=410 RepID=UPI001F12C746|nr:M20 aminoacylase family protein [Methylobacterium organophilum]UMY15526.1 M20 family metallopeptidase [Methylobacterium organophilum]
MSPIDRIRGYAEELTALRRDLHAHPELGFEEVRTSGIVAEHLERFGIEVHRGIGKTGVVGVLRGRPGSRRIGLRADMDALPIEEETNLPYRSTVPGKMHACGHDGHTTMLIGAARYLAETRDFDGTAVFVFQPAEEGLGGARAMIADGLFEKFPVDEIYAVHNAPHGPQGRFFLKPGPAMAAADFFDIRITGRGAHAAQPNQGIDPIVVATALAQAMQSIVSRNADPLKAAVVSITQIHAGAAYNVIPESAHLAGTVRTFDAELRKLVAARIREVAAGIAAAFGATIDVEIRDVFSVLENSAAPSAAALEIAREVFGTENVEPEAKPRMGSEDFADMVAAVPGAYAWIGAAPGPGLHNAKFNFDDAIIPLGAAYLARIIERRCAA